MIKTTCCAYPGIPESGTGNGGNRRYYPGAGAQKKVTVTGNFAVITGDMEVYAPAAARAFEKYHIPCFLDQKHSVFLNPFVEYIRAAVDLIIEQFSYESVFRLLRCGLTDITEEETDRLENYVVAMGNQGLCGLEPGVGAHLSWTESRRMCITQ